MGFNHAPHITIAGSIVGDPLYGEDQRNGGRVVDFDLSCPNDTNGNDEPSIYSIRARSQVADNMRAAGLGDGDWVRVTGRLKIRRYPGEDGFVQFFADIAATDVGLSLYFRPE